MKKFSVAVCLFFIFPLVAYSSELPHPLDFNGNQEEKEKVILYIQQNVKQTYSAIGMDDSTTLRMMEKEELNSFKQLTKIKNRDLLDRVIQQYCGIGMCNYNTILMMFNEQNQASKEKLEW